MKRILIFLTAFAASSAVCLLVFMFLKNQAEHPAGATSQPGSQPDRSHSRARPPHPSPWETLESGLEFAEFTASTHCDLGDSKIRILRIDPAKFEFRLRCAGAPDPQTPPTAQTASQWAKRDALVAVVNACLAGRDGRKSMGFLKTHVYVNNSSSNGQWRVMFGFDRQDRQSPQAAFVDQDRSPNEFDRFKRTFATLDQGPRLFPIGRPPLYPHATDKWSMSGIGVEKSRRVDDDHPSEPGRILFVHVRSPYTMKALAGMLIHLPLSFDTLMLTGRGPDAQLYVNAGGKERQFVGSYQAGVREDDTNEQAPPVANVIGIVRKADPGH